MKDTIQKDKRRNNSIQSKSDYQECWKISLKYSSILIKFTTGINIIC